MTARELAELLRRDCEALFRQLVPSAYVDGGELCGHTAEGKLKMAIRGPKRGRWLNVHIPDRGGDALDLVAWCACGGDMRRAYAWGLAHLGLDRETSAVRRAFPSPAIRDTPTRVAAEPRRGDPLGLYLRALKDSEAIRGYIEERLRVPREQLPAVRCLRFLPRCWHAETNTWPAAMTAPIVDLKTRQHIGTHRTWLELDRGIWRKAPIRPAKKVLGTFRGGIIPLLRGATGRPLAEVVDGEAVLVSEGIENALAAAYLTRAEAMRVWAATSIVNLPNVARLLPPQISRVVIARDNDPGNDAVAKVLAETADLLIDRGLTVEFLTAPERYKDVAEWLSRELPIELGQEL